MKDPAFLFYPNDWIGGTMGMTFEEKGAYIELLMMQFNRGHMTEHMIGQTVGQLWVNIKDKFILDGDGRYFNKRLEEEQNRRKTFTESRRNNIKGENQYTKKTGHINGHMTSHMENENENENINRVIGKEGVGEKPKSPIEQTPLNWRNDFEIYLSGLNETYNKLLVDQDYLKIQERLNPSIDIKLSIEKAYVNFWSTPAGWKHKKKSKSNELDWKSTLTKAIDMNKVYKQREYLKPNSIPIDMPECVK